ncbi:MAG TPA: hypothetical protein VI893_10460, partial [Thermoplasmata archaeon]|nr:hypothetical protein [Thermoplasmata archaeon]
LGRDESIVAANRIANPGQALVLSTSSGSPASAADPPGADRSAPGVIERLGIEPTFLVILSSDE